ncbi:hypothetical protein [Micrococcus sp.]|uniref:hypothetical protein n=1 Tax=Micrococcus sp. TaxID=1271 RepID=UPI002A913083|nr:hypothetical protein [Micrococcus sp.]MDY6055714.1 hypothetical protein [Micrococcus sp.]
MPRSNRPRRSAAARRGERSAGGGGRRRAGPGRADPFEQALGLDTGYEHQTGSDGGWHVRQIPAWRAVKDYTCPGCGRRIPAGQPHLVAWRSDWIMGDEDAGADRRHWHPTCWRTRASR